MLFPVKQGITKTSDCSFFHLSGRVKKVKISLYELTKLSTTTNMRLLTILFKPNCVSKYNFQTDRIRPFCLKILGLRHFLFPNKKPIL